MPKEQPTRCSTEFNIAAKSPISHQDSQPLIQQESQQAFQPSRKATRVAQFFPFLALLLLSVEQSPLSQLGRSTTEQLATASSTRTPWSRGPSRRGRFVRLRFVLAVGRRFSARSGLVFFWQLILAATQDINNRSLKQGGTNRYSLTHSSDGGAYLPPQRFS